MTLNPLTTTSLQEEDPKAKSSHSKTLRNLSKLMQDIAETRNTISRYDALIMELQDRLARNLAPVQQQFQTIRIETFRVLAGHLTASWLKKQQANLLREILGEFADELEDEFGVDLTLERTTLLGQKLLTEAEAKEEAELEALMDAEFEKMFGSEPEPENLFGDPLDLDPDEDPFKSKAANPRGRKPGSSRKSAASENTFKKHEAEEQAMAGDIRALYLLLARALHPDKEADEALKTEKTSWMQKVTNAYSSRNLAELLDILACNPMGSVGPYLSQAPLKTVQGFAKRLRRELTLLRKQAERAFTSVPFQYRGMVGPEGINDKALKLELLTAEKEIAFLKKRAESYRTRSAVEVLIKLLRKHDWDELM